MAKQLIVLALVGCAALVSSQAVDDASVLLQVSKGVQEDSGLPFKDVRNKIQDKLHPEKAAARREKEELDAFDNRKEINAKVMENNRKQAETLQKVYAQQDKGQALHFKKEQQKIDNMAKEKFKSSVSNEQIEKMQETSDKLTQILNSTEAMPEDALMMVLGMTKNGDPNVMGLYQQMSDHAKQYGTNSTYKLLGETQRSKEGWMMAEAGMFGEDEQKAAVEHKKKEQEEEAAHKELKDQAAADYAKAQAAKAPKMQQFQFQNPNFQKPQQPSFGWPQPAAAWPQPAAWAQPAAVWPQPAAAWPQPAAFQMPQFPQFPQAQAQPQAWPKQAAIDSYKHKHAAKKSDSDSEDDGAEERGWSAKAGDED